MATRISGKKKRKRGHLLSLKKEMVIRIYLFLREEYNFIKLHNFDNCNISPMSALVTRTAIVTDLSPSYVSRIVRPYKNCAPAPSTSQLTRLKQETTDPELKQETTEDNKTDGSDLIYFETINLPILNETGLSYVTCIINPYINCAPSSSTSQLMMLGQETTVPETNKTGASDPLQLTINNLPILDETGKESELTDNTFSIKQESQDVESNIQSEEETINTDRLSNVDAVKQEAIVVKLEKSEESNVINKQLEFVHPNNQDEFNIESEMPVLKQEILDLEPETVIFYQEVDVKQELADVKDEKLTINQNRANQEDTEEIDFENEININVLLPEELKSDRPSKSPTTKRKKRKLI